MVHTPYRREKLENTGPSNMHTELNKIKVKNMCLIKLKKKKKKKTPFFSFQDTIYIDWASSIINYFKLQVT